MQPPKGRKLIVVPTGGGKSLIGAQICLDEVAFGRVLMLTHIKELVEQNESELRGLAPELDIGVYCSGLKRWEWNADIVIASVQSIYKKLDELDSITLIVIDECHRITPVGGKMYRAVLEHFPGIPVIGMTATPFRTGTGYLAPVPNDQGVIGPKTDNMIFDQIAYSIEYETLVAEGHLVPFAKLGSELAYSDEGLHMKAGEFIQAELDTLVDDNAKTKAIIAQIVQRAEERWALLIIAINVRHAYVMQRFFAEHGWAASVVHGNLSAAERDEATVAFLSGLYRVEISVGIRTTGFNYPALDCVVLCRPIGSPVLYIQCGGRGTRTAPGKVDCLLLDYGGNIARFGGFGKIEVKEKSASKDRKKCPSCGESNSLAARRCSVCDAMFPEMFKDCPGCAEYGLSTKVDRTTQHCKVCDYYWPINEDGLDEEGKTIIENKALWVDLRSTTFRVHKPKQLHALEAKPDCFVAMHKTIDGATVQEYVFPESFAARTNFEKWWKLHKGTVPAPRTSLEARERRSELVLPQRIHVIRKGKFFNFLGRAF